MTREERKALEQRICNFCYDSAKKSVKTMANYFKKQVIPQSNYVLKQYLQYGITKDLSRKCLSTQIIQEELVNNQSMCFKST